MKMEMEMGNEGPDENQLDILRGIQGASSMECGVSSIEYELLVVLIIIMGK